MQKGLTIIWTVLLLEFFLVPHDSQARRKGESWQKIRQATERSVEIGLGVYACASEFALLHEISSTPRDGQTGIVVGAESIDLPPSSNQAPERACLLLHGFSDCRKDFSDLGPRLAAKGYYVRLARLPGHGTTPLDMARQTSATLLTSFLNDYRDLRNRFNKVDVIGFSMGGTLATLLASREDVRRLVLIAPYFSGTYQWYYGLPPETWNEIMGKKIPFVMKSKRFLLVNQKDSKPDIYSYRCIPTSAINALIELGREAGKAETLESVRCPALLVMAEGDKAASPQAARMAFDSLGSKQKEVRWFSARSNHHLLWDYDAEGAKEAIMGFLSGD